jgi:hypothetical protein
MEEAASRLHTRDKIQQKYQQQHLESKRFRRLIEQDGD